MPEVEEEAPAAVDGSPVKADKPEVVMPTAVEESKPDEDASEE
jgi:hypothetical protein